MIHNGSPRSSVRLYYYEDGVAAPCRVRLIYFLVLERAYFIQRLYLEGWLWGLPVCSPVSSNIRTPCSSLWPRGSSGIPVEMTTGWPRRRRPDPFWACWSSAWCYRTCWSLRPRTCLHWYWTKSAWQTTTGTESGRNNILGVPIYPPLERARPTAAGTPGDLSDLPTV